MLIKDAIEYLNSGNTILDLAAKLCVKKESLIVSKLNRAAVYYDEVKSKWEYNGVFPEISLTRDLTKRIDKLEIDSAYVNKKIDYKESDEVLFNVFKDYQRVKWKDFNSRKTIFFEEEFYDFLKEYSENNSLKLNSFITILIQKGLEGYKIK